MTPFSRSSVRARVDAFCSAFELRAPVLLAPMAGACPPALSIAVAQAGGMGACGCLTLEPEAIGDWVAAVRAGTDGPFQLNLWIPDPPPERDAEAEARVRAFLAHWGPTVPDDAAEGPGPAFDAQFAALLSARPAVVSSIMGLFTAVQVHAIREAGARWFATATTVAEARAAAAAGADAIVAQGVEAGGHRGAFDAASAEATGVGLLALVPAIADAVDVPVVAAGGIADARGACAALALGASAVQVGTAFLRAQESSIPQAWKDRLAGLAPEDTRVTRAFSGRPGRAIATDYVRAAAGPGAPTPAAYPVQRALTAPMRADAARAGDVERMQAWAGQGAGRARASSAGAIVAEFAEGMRAFLDD
ncbi:MAG: nitronate monooxygenase [Pseudomonadales bacterium]|jgi:nitronate monooxygenase|nr:nitronate monooxygenase [Pseudomonadales bacterium]